MITLCAATHKVMLGIEKRQIKKFQSDMLTYFDSNHPEIASEIEEKKVLSDELIGKIVDIAMEFKATV